MAFREKLYQKVEKYQLFSIGVITYILATLFIASMSRGLGRLGPKEIVKTGQKCNLTDGRDVTVTIHRKPDGSAGMTFEVLSRSPVRFDVMVIDSKGMFSFVEGSTHKNVFGVNSTQPSIGPFIGKVFVNATSEDGTRALCDVRSMAGWTASFETTLTLQGSILHRVADIPMVLVKKRFIVSERHLGHFNNILSTIWVSVVVPVGFVLLLTAIHRFI